MAESGIRPSSIPSGEAHTVCGISTSVCNTKKALKEANHIIISFFPTFLIKFVKFARTGLLAHLA